MCNSATRGLLMGTYSTPSGYLNTIEYVTSTTLGNGTDFGDLTNVATAGAQVCDSTRGILGEVKFLVTMVLM